MLQNLFSEGVGIVVGLFLSAFGASVYMGKAVSDKINNYRMKRGVFAASDVYDLLQKTQHSLGAKKALLISAHNGGSFVNPLHPPKITVLAEVYDHGVEATKEHWQGRIADKGIVNLLSSLLVEEKLTLRLGDTVPDGAINQAMLKDGTKGIVIQYIGIIGKMLIYSSFAFNEEVRLNNSNLVELENFVDKVKRKYK